MVYLMCRDEEPLFGEFALGRHPGIDAKMQAIGWLLPDYGMDYELQPTLISYCFCSSPAEADRKIQKMARWLSAHELAFSKSVFEVHCYDNRRKDSLVEARPWEKSTWSQIHSDKVVQLRLA